jgi:signal transduction histidine kinase
MVLKTGEIVESGDPMLLVTNSGNRVAINGIATPIKDVFGEIDGAIVVIRDESKQRAINKLKTDFISLASHQLRTPLTGIKWFIELMQKNAVERPGENQKDFIDKIKKSNKALIELVDDLLAVGRADEGKLNEKKLGEYSVRTMIEEASRLQEQLYLDNNIHLEGVDAIPDNYVLVVDRVQMIQAFGNLLNNAARYSPKGSKVRVWVEKKVNDYLIMVKDEGVGIPKSQQDRVFEKFFRAENVAKTLSGTGLGLYLTKSVIEGHGGEIRFESVEGKGSTFIIRLPINQKKDGKQKESNDS